MTFDLRPADIKNVTRRREYIATLIEHDDRCLVRFKDSTNHEHEITGTYLGRPITGQRSQGVTGSVLHTADNEAICVIADLLGNAEISNTVFVIPTERVLSIENVDGPVRPIGLDEDRLRDAIRHAIGDNIGSGTPLLDNVVADAVTNYRED